jgi:hypothetical protein
MRGLERGQRVFARHNAGAVAGGHSHDGTVRLNALPTAACGSRLRVRVEARRDRHCGLASDVSGARDRVPTPVGGSRVSASGERRELPSKEDVGAEY